RPSDQWVSSGATRRKRDLLSLLMSAISAARACVITGPIKKVKKPHNRNFPRASCCSTRPPGPLPFQLHSCLPFSGEGGGSALCAPSSALERPPAWWVLSPLGPVSLCLAR